MKRFASLMALAFCVSLSSAAAAPARQNSKLDFTLINKTGLVIHELYVSPAKDDEWGDDILGRDVLKNGEKVDITFSPKAKACAWDMKIVDEDKDSVEWTNLDLCKADEITLLYEKGKPTAIIK
jgi:hypothetical protein